MVVAHGGDRSSNLANASREALRQAVANGSVVSWQHMINRRYSFADKAVIRNYFTQLTGLFKNLNYSHDGSSFYEDYFAKIRAWRTPKQDEAFGTG